MKKKVKEKKGRKKEKEKGEKEKGEKEKGEKKGKEKKKKREKEREKRRKREREEKKRKREREEEKKREWFGEHLLHPTLCIKPFCFAFDQMSSLYNPAGYGWYGSYGSWYGRRRGSWGGKSEVRSDVEWFCQTCGTKVLSWNVAGVVFVSLVSSVEDLKPGMTDFFHVGELILGPQLTDDVNDFMSASAAHMTVTNTWMNTHTH